MSTITIDNALYNEAEMYAKFHNISVSDTIKTGLELLFKQFKAKVTATTVNPLTIDKDKNSVLKEIDELIKLKANWDGYGAIPILEDSIHNAKSIVLDESINVSNIEDVQPNPNGTVSIVWSNGMNQVCLEVGTEKMSFFADINGKTSYSNIEKITNENTLKLAAYVNQL